jgi:DNA-binding response OmpR family regulator
MTETILVVEDETSLQETLAYNLKKQGTKLTAGDGQARCKSRAAKNPT